MFLSTGSRSLVAAALGLALGSAALQAGATTFTPPAPVQFDGHYYQVVIANQIGWEAAKAAAAQLYWTRWALRLGALALIVVAVLAVAAVT